jgi:hypothetical protein
MNCASINIETVDNGVIITTYDGFTHQRVVMKAEPEGVASCAPDAGRYVSMFLAGLAATALRPQSVSSAPSSD